MLSVLRSRALLGKVLVPEVKCVFAQSIRCLATDKRKKGHDKPGRDRKNSVREKTREGDRKSSSHAEGTESNIAGMKDILERMDEGVNIPLKVLQPLKIAMKYLISRQIRNMKSIFFLSTLFVALLSVQFVQSLLSLPSLLSSHSMNHEYIRTY